MRRRRGVLVLFGAVLVIASIGACTRGGPRPGTTTTPGGPVPGGPANVQTRTIRYGPFNIPGKNQPATGPFALIAPILGGQAGTGTIWNQPVVNVQKPCTAPCAITKITADLKTTQGETANVHNGLWLHHMVLLVSGQGRRDATCTGLQHVAIGRTNAERLWASGNERTPVQVGGTNGTHGYKLTASDQFHIIMELMNDNEARTPVYIELEYEFVSGAAANRLGNVRPVWLDANGCGVSEVPARTGKYEIHTNTWTAGVAGEFLGTGGHIHDGGTHMDIRKNGQVVCKSEARYGETPEFRPPAGGGGHDHGGTGGDGHGHGSEGSISTMTQCYNVGRINIGDRLNATAYYDDSVHPQMVHNGQLHTVMAIALAYVGTGP